MSAQPIPTSNKPRALSLGFASSSSANFLGGTHHHDSSSNSSALITPNGTPPHTSHHEPDGHFFENKLQQLLSNFESGTHSFDRSDERETPEERRKSFGYGDVNSSSRRSSFLSSLSLSRPFGGGFTSISSSPPSTSTLHNRPSLDSNQHIQSSPLIPHHVDNEQGQLPPNNRSKTTSQINQITKQSGFNAIEQQQQQIQKEKRHFDPSREPKLLGLL
ncbi:uncharacterized protein L201_000257 [Kwoniella dendrophila CBS 6074]|uniref:Cytoplasmic protein n=1 Tax=Kwoniella dendrophila CBS 6074 TaxID=1295534 RepID=A0AAX4JIV8_9TREE